MTETVLTVELREVPIELRNRAAAHIDALQREFELIVRQDQRVEPHEVPARLGAVIQALRDRFAGAGDLASEVLAAADRDGASSVDLTYEVPMEMAEASRQLLQLLAEADDYCRQGDMMTLASPPDIVAFREWALGEFSRQCEGHEPLPWSAVAPSPGEGTQPECPTEDSAEDEGWNLSTEGSRVEIRFAGELDLETAPHLRTLVADASQDPELSKLVLDLSDVTFLDSVGLSVLLTVRMRLVSDDVDVEVVASPAVERVFTLAGVRDMFA